MASVQSETEQKIDSVAKAHREDITELTADWTSLMTQLKNEVLCVCPQF